MTITLDLPRELENELSAEAARLGLPLSEYVVRILAAGRLGGFAKTSAGLVEYWRDEGLVGSRPESSDAREHARGRRSQAGRRTREE